MSDLAGVGFFAGAIIVAVITAILGIAIYLFYSFALYKLAQSRNVEMPWLAWIPIAQLYIIGILVKSMKISTFEIPKLEIVLPAAALATAILGAIPFIGTLISLANIILLLLALYHLYKQYLPEQATVYTVLSILVITVPFLLLKISKMEPIHIEPAE
ncbi:MAG TPA: hypothetical protein VFD00_04840 [Thermoclostridium sp.]|nr:hypothetical protein [Thermoclostridium sp.]